MRQLFEDGERDFWAEEPTRSLPIIGARDRSRGAAPERRPAVTRDRQHTGELPRPERRRTAASDPFVRRLGLMVVAVLSTIPIAATLRDGGADDVLRTAAPAPAPTVSAAPLVAGNVTDGSASAADAPLATSPNSVPGSPATTVILDPKSLPPATPVSTQAPASSAAATTAGAAPSSAAATSAASTTASTSAQRVERVAAVSAPTCTTGYDVVAGDYWILIADKIDVSTADLFAANGAGPDTPLYPGRTICVPAGASPTTTAPATTNPATTAPKPTTTTAPKPTTTAPASTAPATTAPATTAPPTVPARSYSQAEVEQIIREVWPDDLEDEALRIARRESNFQPTAKNFCCYGLFQIYWSVHQGWLSGIGVTSASQLFDPRVNANAALTLYYRAGGWGPWALG